MQPDDTARQILRNNDKGRYTIPTSGLYPYQWNWDSAFAAMGFAEFDLDRAWTELDTLFSGQWDNGMVPHILFHTVDKSYFPGPDVWGCKGPISSSGITQPPIAATMARRVFDKDTDLGRQRLSPLFEKMEAWHRWFMQWRLDNGAVCITHPWEAGRDNAPDWDGAMSRIDPVGVGEYTRRDTSIVDSDMRPTKYDYDRYIWLVQMGRRVDSYDPRDEKFDGKRYWRGPVWGVMNMLIGMGLEEYGMEEGRALRQMTKALIAEHGFAEYFDPRDGSPAGGESFTWTAAVWLGWASPSAHDDT